MRFKYYLRGAGFGILITTIIFTIALRANGLQTQDATPQATETATETEQGATGDDNVKKTVTTENGQTVVRTEQTIEATASAEESSEAASEEATTSAQTREGYITVTITKGEVARDLAEDLQEKGLVTDSEDFRKYMGQVGYDHSMSVGTYMIPEGASYEEIIFILSQ